MSAYYNEHDKQAAAWLRELIKAGLIAPGEVDERDIQDVLPRELVGYTQCHFFAGIGVWSYALRRAGWPDDRKVWTGSCPCQPFSEAGARKGFTDERHLWPAFFHLISVNRPDVVFGEQVADAGGLAWLDVVQADMEAAGYRIGALDLCAAGFGAPHIRQRLFFVANSQGSGSRSGSGRAWRRRSGFANSSAVDQLGDTRAQGLSNGESEELCGTWGREEGRTVAEPGPTNGFWRDAEWIACQDGKLRSTQPSVFPLAHGTPARVGRLRGYGNAIVAPVAEEFIRAYLDLSL